MKRTAAYRLICGRYVVLTENLKGIIKNLGVSAEEAMTIKIFAIIVGKLAPETFSFIEGEQRAAAASERGGSLILYLDLQPTERSVIIVDRKSVKE